MSVPQIHIDNLNVNLVGTRAAVNDESPRLEWSKTLCGGKRVNRDEAEAAIKALGPDWRFPSRRELESRVDHTRHEPAVAPGTFPDDDTESAYYWTGTECAWSSDFFWIVSFDYGYVYNSRRDNDACVRAVRSVSPSQ